MSRSILPLILCFYLFATLLSSIKSLHLPRSIQSGRNCLGRISHASLLASINESKDITPTSSAIQFKEKVRNSLLAISVPLAAAVVASKSANAASTMAKEIELPSLPYAYNSLEPFISEETMKVHHDKHHAKYVSTVNSMVGGTDLAGADIETIVRKSFGKNQALFNNAAQCYNHAFYWRCMKPNGGGFPSGKIATLINKYFGSYETFRTEFLNAGLTAFGSGWAWLVWTPSGLKVTKTIGADNPLTDQGSVPLLTMDVWEHAYYLDYQNLRNKYEDSFVDKLINWDFVSSQLPSNAN